MDFISVPDYGELATNRKRGEISGSRKTKNKKSVLAYNHDDTFIHVATISQVVTVLYGRVEFSTTGKLLFLEVH